MSLSPEKFYNKNRLLSRLKTRTKFTEDGHWLWIGKTTPQGRGVMQIGGVNGKYIEVHRVSAYIHHNLNLKDSNQHALHKNNCLHKNCWNPNCLYVGNHQDNMNDIKSLPNFRCGHLKFGNSKVLSSGRVRCKICHNEMNRRRRQKTNQSNESEGKTQ